MPAYLGQHFLIDEGIAQSAVDALEIAPGDTVVEIGPGRGVLTRKLVATPATVIAVELDQDLIGELRRDLPESERFSILHGDFLRWEMDKALGGAKAVKFIGNLPYAVASPILQKVLEWPKAHSAVFMFQKEVCDRLTAGPGSRAYGVLSVVAALHAEVSWVAEAPRDRFRPRPTVESGVLKFRMRKQALPKGVSESALLRVVKAAFSQRRKQVVNPLAHALGLPKERVIQVLKDCGIDPAARAEELSVGEYSILASVFKPAGPKRGQE